MGFKSVLDQYEFFTDRNTRDHLTEYRVRGSHTRGVYPTQDTSCMRTARVKQEEREDRNNSMRVVRNLEEKNIGTKRKNPKQGRTSANGLTIELPGARVSLHHRLD